MADQDLRAWALRGAEQRLAEMAQEAARIYAAFPELRGRQTGTRGRRRAAGAATSRGRQQESPQKRSGRRMSADARRRIAEAQRKRWAAWREKKSGGAQAEAPARKRGRKRKSG